MLLEARLVTSSIRTNARSALFDVPSGGSTLITTSAAGSGVGLGTGTGVGPLLGSVSDEHELLSRATIIPSVVIDRTILMRGFP